MDKTLKQLKKVARHEHSPAGNHKGHIRNHKFDFGHSGATTALDREIAKENRKKWMMGSSKSGTILETPKHQAPQ